MASGGPRDRMEVARFKQLPLTSHLPGIFQTIQQSALTAILAPAGYGKSTLIPWAGTVGGVVGDDQARRVLVIVEQGAQELVRYLSSIGQQLDIRIGLGLSSVAPDAQLVYVEADRVTVDETFLDRLMEFDLVILDGDIHESALGLLILGYWYEQTGLDRPVPKLVITSGVLEPARFNYAQVYLVRPPTNPVELMYHSVDLNPSDADFASKTARVVYEFRGTDLPGDWIVVVPNRAMALTLSQILDRYEDFDRAITIEPFQTVGRSQVMILTPDQLALIGRRPTRILFDTMLVDRVQVNSQGGLRPKTIRISQAEAERRLYLVNQTDAGLVYRMVTRRMYASLPRNRIEPAQPVRLQAMLIKAGISSDRAIEILERLFRLLGRPKGRSPIDLIEDLNPTTAQLLVASVLSPRNTQVLGAWIDQGWPIFPALVVLSMLDSYGPSYFWYPMAEPLNEAYIYQVAINEHLKRFFNRFRGWDDLETLSRIAYELMEQVVTFEQPVQLDLTNLETWARQNSLDRIKLAEVAQVIELMINRLSELGYEIPLGPFDLALVNRNLRSIIGQVYRDRTAERVTMSETRVVYRTKDRTYNLDQRYAINWLHDPTVAPRKIVVLSEQPFDSTRSYSWLARVSVAVDPIDPSRLNETPSLLNGFELVTNGQYRLEGDRSVSDRREDDRSVSDRREDDRRDRRDRREVDVRGREL